ncbi:MAG TPA: hypothetical protein VIV11_33405, partial [Kofleriaceae bacterium]
VLVNARGKKVGSVGRPLPGSPSLVVAGWNFDDNDFVRDGTGKLVRARLDEPGMLIARLSRRAGTDVAHIDPRRLLRDAFEPGDLWFVTGDFFEVDVEGDFWHIDRQGQMVRTKLGAVGSTRIEDAIYEAPDVALCIAGARPDADDPPYQEAIAAIQLHSPAFDIETLSAAVATLPEYARPRRIRIVDEIPLTDGLRPIKRMLRELDFGDGDSVYAWDARAQHYVPTSPLTSAASGSG